MNINELRNLSDSYMLEDGIRIKDVELNNNGDLPDDLIFINNDGKSDVLGYETHYFDRSKVRIKKVMTAGGNA
ncbi:hypothetical protein [Peptostreptococcus faecalis]|uniref:hypothetical protein n=1 Tax=Peptostreptococcus faecalis TaxID=2045015 RepID=UPI000C7CF1C3|nr:hypothetical protein [Peptostreptococcus faecalis]